MALKSPLLVGACAVVAVLVGASPALASTMTITAPATALTDSLVKITYAGMADAPGTTDVTGTGDNMTLRTFYERNATSCAPTSAGEKARPEAKFDGNTFVESPAPFSLESTATFTTTGNFRFCAYLEAGLNGDNAPPAAAAETVIQVGAPPIPCTVPKLKGLTLTAAKAKLKTAGCTLGKVTKPKKSGKKKLIVRSQDQADGNRYATGFKVNIVLKVKAKKK